MKLSIMNIKGQFKKLWNRGAFHIFIGSFLSKFVAFFGSIFLVRVLSKSSYGLLGYIENIYGYIHIFAGLGLGNALLRYVILGKTTGEKLGYYRYTLTRGTAFNIILVLFVAVGAIYYPHPKEFEAAKWLISMIFFALPFQYLIESNALTYRAMLDNKRYANTAFIASTTLIISRYIGAVFFGLKGVVAVNIAINVIFGITLCLVTYILYFKDHHPYHLKKREKKIVNKYSVQYMITNGMWAFFMLNDIFLLGRLCGSSMIVADYKVAYVLPGNISIISTAIGIFVGPYFVQHESDYKWVWGNYKKVLLIIAGLITPVVAILFVFAKPIIALLYGVQYENVVPIMRLLLIAALINSAFRYTSAHLLSSMGQIKYNMAVSFLGVLFQIAINLITIPIYGAVGAACTSIGVYTFMAITLFFVFRKKYRFSIVNNRRRWLFHD